MISAGIYVMILIAASFVILIFFQSCFYAPTLPTLEAICKEFGITLAQFFTEDGESQMTKAQRILFSRWSTLTEEQQKILLDLMRTM